MKEQHSAGVKYDGDKPPMHLLSPAVTLELAKHFGRGAKKYAERNWEKGLTYSRVSNALERHLAAWKMGEEYDEEGFRHITAVNWCAHVLCHFELYPSRYKEFDDRCQKMPEV